MYTLFKLLKIAAMSSLINMYDNDGSPAIDEPDNLVSQTSTVMNKFSFGRAEIASFGHSHAADIRGMPPV
jgi:hypothetical protein